MSDIAINPVTRRVQFIGNTGTGPYAFTFNILQSSDIIVYKNNVLLTETTDYTVTIDANGTGNVTMVVALVSTDILTMIGGRELSRTTDFVTAGDLLASSLNEQLDSNVIMSQQLDERFGRTIKAQPGDEDATLDLPLVADRVDKIMLFDTEGNLTAASASDFFTNSVLGGNYIINTATGNGSQTAFGLTSSPSVKTNIQVYIDGVYQNKDTFSLSGSTLTFSEAPPLNAAIEFMMGEAVTQITGDASAITYNQGGTGAQDRTVKAKLQEFVSVKDFGAVGDGVTDDTAAIQAAIDSFSTRYGGLYFPKGEYNFSSVTIDESKSLSVFGDGRASALKGTLVLQGIGVSQAGSVYKAHIYDLAFVGSDKATDVGIQCQYTWHMTIQNCHFNTLFKAISISSSVRDQIVGNYFEECEQCLYQEVDGIRSADITYTRNQSSANIRRGVVLNHMDGFFISDNVFFGSTSYPTYSHIQFSSAANTTNWCRILNNTFFEAGSASGSNSSDYGAIVMNFTGGRNLQTIISNNIFGWNYQPIAIYGTSANKSGRLLITDNYIEHQFDNRSQCHSIFVQQAGGGVDVYDNRIYRTGATSPNTYDAIHLDNVTMPRVRNNNILNESPNTSRYGVNLVSCVSSYVSGNDVQGAGTGSVNGAVSYLTNNEYAQPRIVGLPWAIASFDASGGSVAPLTSYNCSVSYVSTGRYKVTFDVAIPGSFALTATCSGGYCEEVAASRSATEVQIFTRDSSGSLFNSADVSVLVF